MAQQIATIHGRIAHDLFQVTLKVNKVKVHHIVVDTGAAALIFNGEVARRLRLPNLGAVRVVGVGGTTAGFRSKCQLQVGTKIFRDVPCVVIKGFSKPGMLGLKFFIDNHLSIYLDPIKQTLYVFRS
ncbi:retropepsin-like aspartic protease [Alicyclobacillus mengziensis]|uniref:Retroviral-like aspartic protease family protein n=1 Tax=Alicyclobacillus mengziensis TaxID=2931921 RepID=A0A9X7Z5I5_9BACL|nr:retropepsin-like aspartic protease [Alicyclobacillus mengziensis]QSO46352.1 retroviral-like aspartic protease family protein [Alicyclobacillus mengziensis]